MSLLHSYSFIKEVDPRAYLPFGYSARRGSGIGCALEVIDAAKAGKIDLDKVEEAAMSGDGNTDPAFNLYAYNCAVHKNREKVSYAESGRLLHISGIDKGAVEPYGVPESVVTEYAEQADEYEKLMDEYEFRYAVSAINDMRLMIFIEYRMDFWRCMQQALKGIPESVALLRNLAEKAPDIGELIWIILSNGRDMGRIIELAGV